MNKQSALLDEREVERDFWSSRPTSRASALAPFTRATLGQGSSQWPHLVLVTPVRNDHQAVLPPTMVDAPVRASDGSNRVRVGLLDTESYQREPSHAELRLALVEACRRLVPLAEDVRAHYTRDADEGTAKLVLVVSTSADVQSVLDAEDVLNLRIFELATSSIPFVEVAVRYDWTAAS